MKILYGVQGTGNGHTSRARAMAKCFAKEGMDVTYLFSGRDPDKYFDMECFGAYLCYRGLTFSTHAGQVNYLNTIFSNNIFQFFGDILKLDLDSYDVILTDFEPITAWAGKLKKKPVISVGHQPAFRSRVPVTGENRVSRLLMNNFAPAMSHLGLHWHHFNSDILPPIVNVDATHEGPAIERKVIVYLPFEDLAGLTALIETMTEHDFYIYHPEITDDMDSQNRHFRKLSVDGFQKDLHSAESVICNAGFELSSECLQLGKRLLVKPVKKQMEQLSNAVALEQLGLADSLLELDQAKIAAWLNGKTKPERLNYPDVAEAIVAWLKNGKWDNIGELKEGLWASVNMPSLPAGV